MRLYLLVTFLSLFTSPFANAIAQAGVPDAANGLAQRDDEFTLNQLYKRKGGGGGGGRGGGGSSGSSGSRSGSSGSSGGTGAPRSFAGGKYYGGGAARPYKAGSRSPSGITPLLFVGAAALAFWPGVWLYGAYHYPYTNPYRFYNETTDEDEELPIICGCDPYNPCGCDENGDTEYLDALVGDGDYDDLDKDIVTVAEVNGTTTLLINGTLPNGTTPPEDNVAFGMRSNLDMLGYWPIVALALSAVFLA